MLSTNFLLQLFIARHYNAIEQSQNTQCYLLSDLGWVAYCTDDTSTDNDDVDLTKCAQKHKPFESIVQLHLKYN